MTRSVDGAGVARTRQRDDARACFERALGAVEPETLVDGWLRAHAEPLGRVEGIGRVEGQIRIVAIGKAAAAMARGAVRGLEAIRPEATYEGVVIAPAGPSAAPREGSSVPAGLQTFAGGHPLPSAAGVEGAERVLETARALAADDLLLVLISGGGSALATAPPEGVALEDVQTTTEALLRAGATIDEVNCVRKHLDRLKGGRLARVAAPARVLALVLSDVVGDPLDVIASGPVTGDPTCYADARAILERRGVWPGLPASVRRHVEAGERGERPESPGPDDPVFERVRAEVIGSNARAADAALAEAQARGYSTLLLTTLLEGEACQAGRFLASIGREVRRSGRPLTVPACLLAAGETTVTVRGDGKGGRNQELALGAALALRDAPPADREAPILVASLGTDGVDGPTDAAGACADDRTVDRAEALGLDVRDHLRRNDSNRLFDHLDDLIVTGPTGTNVMDLVLVLVGEPGPVDSSP